MDTVLSIVFCKRFMDNILSNLTQYEGDHYNRINYLKYMMILGMMGRDENFKFYNPFYRSVFSSLLEFFHISGVHWFGFNSRLTF